MTRATYTGPANPIGYIELQTSWTGDLLVKDIQQIIDDLRAKGLSENVGFTQWGARVERATDGAGVEHFTLYMGFAPLEKSSEPLDPHNLGAAPAPQSGMIDPSDTDAGIPMGWREGQFGRGT